MTSRAKEGIKDFVTTVLTANYNQILYSKSVTGGGGGIKNDQNCVTSFMYDPFFAPHFHSNKEVSVKFCIVVTHLNKVTCQSFKIYKLKHFPFGL